MRNHLIAYFFIADVEEGFCCARLSFILVRVLGVTNMTIIFGAGTALQILKEIILIA